MSFKDFIEGVRDFGPQDDDVTNACDEIVDKFYPLRCKNCGSQFTSKAKFCIECGRKL